MDQQLQGMYGATSDVFAVRHRVLRNTYWLLALSMIPTVLGAWIGVQLKFSLFAGSPMLSFIAFLAIAFGFFYAIEKTKHSATGVAVLLGFTFLCVQGYEYYHLYTDLNLKLNSGIFGSTFFMLTGFHGFHVFLGMLMLLFITLRLHQGHFSAERHFGFEGAAWYWHFVDVVWLGLYVLVYWM